MKNLDIIIQCCLCKKIKIENGWVVQSQEQYSNTKISHRYCPDCEQKHLLDLEIIPIGSPLCPYIIKCQK